MYDIKESTEVSMLADVPTEREVRVVEFVFVLRVFRSMEFRPTRYENTEGVPVVSSGRRTDVCVY